MKSIISMLLVILYCIVKVVRLGHPARLEPTVLQYSLDAVVAGSESAGIILDVRHDIDKAYVCVSYIMYNVQ